MHGAHLWELQAEPFASLDAAKQAMARTEHGGNNAKWAANQTGCKKYWHCDFHKECPVQLRISEMGGQGKWRIQVLNVQHGLHLKECKRKNSALTYVEDAHVQQLVAKGQKPRYEQLRSSDMPRGVNYNWEKARDVKNSMYRVEVDTDTSHILECDANPHNFKCGK